MRATASDVDADVNRQISNHTSLVFTDRGWITGYSELANRKLCSLYGRGQMLLRGGCEPMVSEDRLLQNIKRLVRFLIEQPQSILPATSFYARHRFATEVMDAIGNPIAVRDVMGHSRFDVTRAVPLSRIFRSERGDREAQSAEAAVSIFGTTSGTKPFLALSKISVLWWHDAYAEVAPRSSLIREYVDVSSFAMNWEKAMPAEGNCRTAFRKAVLGINAAWTAVSD